MESDTGFVIARSMILIEFPVGQFVMVRSGRYSFGTSVGEEKELSSIAV